MRASVASQHKCATTHARYRRIHSSVTRLQHHCVPAHARRRTTACSAAALDREQDVIIVGGGMAGLSAGRTLKQAGIPFVILESSDGVGGRVRTDQVEGFQLDRGFQIFLTGYPEAQEMLDYVQLDLKPFYAGAQVRHRGAFHRVADPLRHPIDGVVSLLNPIGSPGDKVNVGLYRLKALRGTLEAVLQAPETTTLQALQNEGFSPAIIDRFFKPFLGGIFFDRSLDTTSRLLQFVMRMLAVGQNCLPAQGIGAAAEQLAAGLPQGCIHTGTKVAEVRMSSQDRPASVKLADGQELRARRGVVVATEGPAAAKLLGRELQLSPSQEGSPVGTCNLYFRTPRVPQSEPILYLDGDGEGPINNACFPSTVAPSYAPAGQHLASLSTIGTCDDMTDEQLADAAKRQMSSWFGADQVAGWKLLKVYRIPFAQPPQAPPTDLSRAVQMGGRLYVAGDHRDSATLDGALKSGRRAAEALLADTVQESANQRQRIDLRELA